jgi:hypothetical protein
MLTESVERPITESPTGRQPVTTFTVITNLRTFSIEAAGIGDAIDQVLNHGHMAHSAGEYLREIKA